MKTPHQRIMKAAKNRRGVRLSADEVASLALDDAIATRAARDSANDEGETDEEYCWGDAARAALGKEAT